jgi:hypothetical protein
MAHDAGVEVVDETLHDRRQLPAIGLDEILAEHPSSSSGSSSRSVGARRLSRTPSANRRYSS